MKSFILRVGTGLFLVNLLAVVLILNIALFPNGFLRIVLGVPFVLFFPGYALIAALFPKGGSLSPIERIALSLGLSVAVTALIGLVINYTPWGIRLESILCSLFGFIVLTSIVSCWRRRRLSVGDRISFGFDLNLSGFWKGGRWDKVLSVVLALVVVGAIASAAYAVARPNPGEQFTEFYILGPGGKTADYPSEVKVGESAEVTGGIVNHLLGPGTYRLEVLIAGTKNAEVGPIELRPGEKWEGEVNFTPQAVGTNQKVEFVLHETPQVDVTLRSLHLWVDVVQ